MNSLINERYLNNRYFLNGKWYAAISKGTKLCNSRSIHHRVIRIYKH